MASSTGFGFDVDMDGLLQDSKKRKAESKQPGDNGSGNAGGDDKVIAAGNAKQLGQVDLLFQKLQITQAKEMNRLSREVAELKAINTICVLVPLDCDIVAVGKEAAKKYNDAVQGNKNHGLGPSDYLVSKAILSAIAKMQGVKPTLQEALSVLVPTLNKIEDFRHNILSCKVLDTHDSSIKRIELAFGLPMRQYVCKPDARPLDLQIEVCSALESITDSKVCIGKAPRNQNVRKISSVLDDLKRLGVKGIAVGKGKD